MSSTPTLPGPTDQRVLAAIVFTDVVGFSARMEAQESLTLRLLERDFAAMRSFSNDHSGAVIKTTGDGLMLHFTSAVQAVEWALKAQRHFAGQTGTLSEAEILQHRVGIHLGDVFVSAGDVMGDGVNVAARVQGEARPGGICISQMVYGVVKNKLKLDTIRLEPRKLKNINEPIQMYHVLLEPPARHVPVVVQPQMEAVPAPARPENRPRSRLVIALLTLGLGVAGVFLFQAYQAQQAKITGSEKRRDALAAALHSETALTAAGATKPAAGATAAAAEEFDFVKMTSSRPAAAGVSPAQDLALQRARESIRILDTWRAAALQRRTQDRPLDVRPLRGPGRQVVKVFTDASQQLYFAIGGVTQKRLWPELERDMQGAIIASLLESSPVPPAREVVYGAAAFAFVHGLPELAAALPRR